MNTLDYQKSCLADWQKFNSFNWHPETDPAIAQEIYKIYLGFLESETLTEDKKQFVQYCIKDSLPHKDAKLFEKELFKHHVKGKNLPETLDEILTLAKAFQKALAKMEF